MLNFTCAKLNNSFSSLLKQLKKAFDSYIKWVIPEKIHTPTTEGMPENLTGGGINGSGNPDGMGAPNLKIHP